MSGGPQRSGRGLTIAIRSNVTSPDTDHPNSVNPTAPYVVTVEPRSRDAWVTVRNDAPTGAPTVVVTVYGSNTALAGDGQRAAAGSWRSIGQLNDGLAIVAGSGEPVGLVIANRIFRSFAFPGLLGWRYLWPVLTTTVGNAFNSGIYIDFEIEEH